MANIDRVNGFKPVGTLSGGMGAQGYIQKCLHDEDDAEEIAVGDAVRLVASNEGLTIPTVTVANTAGETPYGICVGVELWDGSDASVTATLDRPRYIAGSIRGYTLIAIAPDLIMEVQGNGVVEDGDVGAKADVIDATPDTSAQTSGQEIDISTAAATATLVYHILEVIDRGDNELGNWAKLLVTFNIHELGHGIYDVGQSDTSGHVGVHN